MKIFAVSCGMGVVSGLAMGSQFGTNWRVFAEKVGNVFVAVIAGWITTEVGRQPSTVSAP